MNKSKVINLSLEDITPYSIGEYQSVSNKWIDFGKNNDYPEYLRSLYLNSPTHQAVIDGTTNLATGEGVEVVNPEKNPISNKWVNENFPKDVIKNLISDLKLYGYCVIEVYGGETVKYVEAIKYRFDVRDKSSNINYMWYSNDWNNYNYKKNNPIKIPIYREGTEEDVSVYVAQLDKKGFDYYSPVDYNGGINYISLESEISIYHLSNIKNGLFPSFLATFIGSEYSEEQMNEIERNINKKFGGSTNTGRAIISFVSSKDEVTDLKTIDQPNIDNTYTFLSKECTEKILLAHGVTTPLMFGVRDTGGGLGSNSEELEKSFYLYYESKLKHYQNYILEMIKKVMNGNLLFADVVFKTYNPFANNKNTQTLSRYNELDNQVELNLIESLKTMPDEVLLSESIFNGVLNENCLYKYVKASKNNNMINKKLEILDKKGYVFRANENIIKNTKDFYFIEQKFLKKIE